MEIWTNIQNYENDYQISNMGRIKSLKYNKEKILKQHRNKNGYFFVILLKNKKRKNIQIHTLVYETFHNNKLKSNECVHHKDENKENNYLENLEKMIKLHHNRFHMSGIKNYWFGKKRSSETCKKLSESKKGKNNPNFGKITSKEIKKKMINNNKYYKLSEKLVIEIKLLFIENKLKIKEIAKLYNVSSKTIYDIKNKKRWSFVGIN